MNFPCSFRFIVSKDGEYSDNLTDPDAVIDWELVEFVLCSQASVESTTCSICLNTPICPRVAKCGHIFCWPCILQLFSYHEHSSLAPCPVCLREKIRVVDLRPVIIESFHLAIAGAIWDFSLIQRPKHLNLLFPAANDILIDAKAPLPSFENGELARFNRLIVTAQLSDLLRSEASTLDQAIAEAKSCQETTLYLEIAQQMLLEELAALDTPSELTGSTSTLLSPLSKPPPKQRLSDLIPDSLDAADSYFFYQSSDGQQLFLHPLNWHYLSKEFNESNFPTSLSQVKVLDLESKTIDEKTRRRLPALSHLPTSCQYRFALIDMSGILKDPLNQASFAEEVQKRSASIELQNQREARHAAVIAEQAAAKRTADLIQSLSVGSRFAPEIVPPDLDDQFPEIGSLSVSANIPISSHLPTHSSLSSSSPSKAPSAWDNGRLRTSLQRQPEEAFPALPVSPTSEPGHIVLTDSNLDRLQHSSMSFSAAVSSPASSSHPKPNNKKKGKKTVLVL